MLSELILIGRKLIKKFRLWRNLREKNLHYLVLSLVLKERRSGDKSKEATPVPISNTAVKLFSAEGS